MGIEQKVTVKLKHLYQILNASQRQIVEEYLNKKVVAVVLSVVVVALVVMTAIYSIRQHPVTEHQKAMETLSLQQEQQDLAFEEKKNRKSNNANK